MFFGVSVTQFGCICRSCRSYPAQKRRGGRSHRSESPRNQPHLLLIYWESKARYIEQDKSLHAGEIALHHISLLFFFLLSLSGHCFCAFLSENCFAIRNLWTISDLLIPFTIRSHQERTEVGITEYRYKLARERESNAFLLLLSLFFFFWWFITREFFAVVVVPEGFFFFCCSQRTAAPKAKAIHSFSKLYYFPLFFILGFFFFFLIFLKRFYLLLLLFFAVALVVISFYYSNTR